MEGSRRSYDGQLGGDNLEVTELRLGLPGSESVDKPIPQPNKRFLPAGESECKNEPKAQAVGWPPVRARRRDSMQIMRINRSEGGDENNGTTAIYVKVSMDGAPYLRKIDLKVYEAYKDLRQNLEDMFKCFSLGEHVVAYEDKDGDWMMVGDVPWEMFTSTCKRLRIMKESEARGLGSS